VGLDPVVSSAGPHFGEERVLVGRGGSGTIFFAGCNLGCIFCQNYDISHECRGQVTDVDTLARTMLQLQDIGCVNINFVTPTHMAPAMAQVILRARDQGLTLPIVYNSGGYDAVETLQHLQGLVDIYMPDLKFSDSDIAARLCHAADYPQVSREAVREMHHQVGDLVIQNSLAVRGLLVRHLVLPEDLAGSDAVIEFLAHDISPTTAINVMDQYRPCYQAQLEPALLSRPTVQEIQYVRNLVRKKGLRIID
jgi:putative pyruvate formate lyase activating enzyme